jgi:hypothetical protein
VSDVTGFPERLLTDQERAAIERQDGVATCLTAAALCNPRTVGGHLPNAFAVLVLFEAGYGVAVAFDGIDDWVEVARASGHPQAIADHLLAALDESALVPEHAVSLDVDITRQS